jgi:hypothetical protein
MTVKDALNRGTNFFAVTGLTILATSIIHGLQISPELPDKLDEIAVGVLTLVGLGWYNWGRNRFRRSLMPFVLLIGAAAAKVAGMFITVGRFLPGGVDFAIALFLLLFALVFLWQYLMLLKRERRWRRLFHGV